MKLLITNDDGISAKGINALFDVLSLKHDVFLVAPAEERSACSNAITMRDPLIVTKVTDNKYSVSGYPADCVNVGLYSGIIPSVDTIISGINHGPNLGDDVHYSGTVAAARVGFIHGKNGIAVSYNSKDNINRIFDAADFISNFLEDYIYIRNSKKIFLNINYPAINISDIKGVKHTKLSKRKYIDSYKILKKDHDSSEILLDGYIETDHESGTDDAAINAGYVSITPLCVDVTDYVELSKIMSDGN